MVWSASASILFVFLLLLQWCGPHQPLVLGVVFLSVMCDVLCIELQYICIISWCICTVTYGFVCGFPVCWVVDALSCCSAILVSALECVLDVCVTGVWLFCVLLSGVGFV
jgi:hypothetical protein